MYIIVMTSAIYKPQASTESLGETLSSKECQEIPSFFTIAYQYDITYPTQVDAFLSDDMQPDGHKS